MVKGQKADFLVDLGGTPSTQLRKTSLEEPDLNECRLSLKGVCTEYMSRLEQSILEKTIICHKKTGKLECSSQQQSSPPQTTNICAPYVLLHN